MAHSVLVRKLYTFVNSCVCAAKENEKNNKNNKNNINRKPTCYVSSSNPHTLYLVRLFTCLLYAITKFGLKWHSFKAQSQLQCNPPPFTFLEKIGHYAFVDFIPTDYVLHLEYFVLKMVQINIYFKVRANALACTTFAYTNRNRNIPYSWLKVLHSLLIGHRINHRPSSLCTNIHTLNNKKKKHIVICKRYDGKRVV